MGKNKTTVGINRMEVDEKTSELKIVREEPKDLDETFADESEIINVEEKLKQQSIGKQLFMSKVLGINESSKNIDKRQKYFKRLITAIFLVFIVGVLVYTFYKDFFASEHEPVSLDNLWRTFANNWYYIVLGLLSLFVCYVVKGFKLSVICRSQIKKWHFKTCFETGIVGHYYNNVTPLGFGGQPFEIYHLSKHGVHGGVAASMPIVAFFFYQFAFVSMGIASLVCFNRNIFGIPEEFINRLPAVFNILAIIGLVAAIIMPSLVVVFSMLPRLGAKLVHFVTFIGGKLKILKNPRKTELKTLKTVIHNSICIKKFAKNPLALITTLLLSVLEVTAFCSISFFTLKFFGYDDNKGTLWEWLWILQMSIILYASISFIPTPGNSGAADLSFYILFSVGLKIAGFSFAAMAVWRILSFYSFIIIGFIFVTLRRKKDHRLEFLGIADLEK